jgi:hypothetical protein
MEPAVIHVSRNAHDPARKHKEHCVRATKRRTQGLGIWPEAEVQQAQEAVRRGVESGRKAQVAGRHQSTRA